MPVFRYSALVLLVPTPQSPETKRFAEIFNDFQTIKKKKGTAVTTVTRFQLTILKILKSLHYN
jgi:hypothetical protein